MHAQQGQAAHGHAASPTISTRDIDPTRIDDKHFYLFGVRVENTSMESAVDDVCEIIENGPQAAVAYVNADCLNTCFNDGEYHWTLRNMDRVFADGIGVRLAAQFFGEGVVDNVNGTDLFPLLCERLAQSGHGLFLLGAREGIPEAVAENMKERYPGLKIAGTHHGYFSEDEEDAVIEKINASGAKALLVAFGAPRQELWIAENRDRLEPSMLMGVGGLFDFYSGRIKRAPLWMRKMSMEWVYRLLQEPGRMWRRYIIGNPKFLYRAWAQRKRNGSVARSLDVTPQEEAALLENFSKGVARQSFRTRLLSLGHVFRRLGHDLALGMKRLLDIVVALTMLILSSPLTIGTYLAIRIESPGPAFYSQIRVGERGKDFRLWKFRSMYRDADARRAALEAENEMEGGVIFKMKKDPRITRVGRFIRKFSIDELPQLWNILKGDMSLVGPRPALPAEVEQYSIEERVRLMAKPGLTCFWQVAGRSEIPFDQQVLMDEEYLYEQSVVTDIKLLFKTIPAVLFGRGAY